MQRRRDEYLAFVAHDLRTPLGAIALCTRLVEQGLETADGAASDVGHKLTIIRRNVRQLQDLIGAVLSESSRVDMDGTMRLSRRRFDLWPFAEALVQDLQATAAARATRLINAIPEELVVYADAVVLRRVLQNLVANALAFTANGEVVLSAVAGGDDGSAVLLVRDTGTGIPPERLAQVFEKHETHAAPPGGLGLGLAIVRTMIEAHGGTVAVESAVGVGTTFRIAVPGVTVSG